MAQVSDHIVVVSDFEQIPVNSLRVTGADGTQRLLSAQLAKPVFSVSNGLTALASGGQPGATPLTATINRVTTVGTAADSVLLPAATPGQKIIVVNAAASNAMAVFPNTGDAINAGSANASVSVAAGKTEIFVCAVTGTWNTVLSA